MPKMHSAEKFWLRQLKIGFHLKLPLPFLAHSVITVAPLQYQLILHSQPLWGQPLLLAVLTSVTFWQFSV